MLKCFYDRKVVLDEFVEFSSTTEYQRIKKQNSYNYGIKFHNCKFVA